MKKHMKKNLCTVLFLILSAASLPAESEWLVKSANVKNNWISGEVAAYNLGNYCVSARYERMIDSKISFGANVILDLFSPDMFGMNIDAFFRWYPWGRTFYLGAALGLYYYTRTFTSAFAYTVAEISAGVAITPEIGWKIDVGKAGGFYLQPGMAFPFVLPRFNIGGRLYFGMGYAF